MQVIALPNGQQLGFPDGMSQDDMASAIQKNFPEYAPKTGGLSDTWQDVKQAAASNLHQIATTADLSLEGFGGAVAHGLNSIGLLPDSAMNYLDKDVTNTYAEADQDRDANPAYAPHTLAGKVVGGAVHMAPALIGSVLAPEAAPLIFGAQGALEGGENAIDQGDSLRNAQMKSVGQGALNALAGEFFGGGANLFGKAFAPVAADTVGNLALRAGQGAAINAALKPAGTAVDYLADQTTGEAPPAGGYDWMPGPEDLILGGLMGLPHAGMEFAGRHALPDAPTQFSDGTSGIVHRNGTLFSSEGSAQDFIDANNLDTAAPIPVTRRMLDPTANSDDVLGYAARSGMRPAADAATPDIADIAGAQDADQALDAFQKAVGDVQPPQHETLEQTLANLRQQTGEIGGQAAEAAGGASASFDVAGLGLEPDADRVAPEDQGSAGAALLRPSAQPLAETPATAQVAKLLQPAQDTAPREAGTREFWQRGMPAQDTAPAEESPAVGPAVSDRRQDLAQRKRVDEMSPDEMRVALRTDDLTGLANYRAFAEDMQDTPGQHVMYGDVDDLKLMNDRYGHPGTDQILSAVGALKRSIADRMGLTAHRRSGDEFLAKNANYATLEAYGKAVQDHMSRMVVDVELPDGSVVKHKGVGFSYGIGANEEAAEAAAVIQKAERKQLGLRTGSRDTGATLESASGRTNPESDVAAAQAPSGEVTRQSQRESQVRPGLTKLQLDAALARQRADWQGFQNIHTYKTLADVPADIRARLPDGAGAFTDGFYDGPTHSVHLIADKIPTPERAQWVAAHEVITHVGLRGLRDSDINEALNVAAKNKFIRSLATSLAQERGLDMSSPGDRNIAHEEALAELGAAMYTDRFDSLMKRYGVNVPEGYRNGVMGTIQRVFDAIRRYIGRIIGRPASDVPDGAVRSMLMDANRALRNPDTLARSEGPTMFSRGEQAAPEAPHRMTFEVAPDPRNTELKARWDALPQDKQWAISREVAQQIVPEVLDSFHDPAMRGEVHEQLGGWMDDTNPSLSVWLRHDAPPDKVDAATRMLGSALRQEAMMRTSTEPFMLPHGEMTEPSGWINIRMPEGQDVHSLYTKIRSIVDADGKPYVQGHTTAGRDMSIIHMNEARIPTEDLARRIADTIGEPYDVHTSQLYVDFPEKGDDDYGLSRVQENSGGERPSLRAQSDVIRAASDARIEQLVTRAEGRGAARPDDTQAGGGRAELEPVGRDGGSANAEQFGRERDAGRLSTVDPRQYQLYEGVEREKQKAKIGIGDSIIKALQPASFDMYAEQASAIGRHLLAEQARERALATRQVEKYAPLFSKMPVAESYAFIDRMEHGAKQPTPELQQVADALRRVLDWRRDQVIALGKGALENFNENYFPHIWKDRAKASTFFSRRPLEGGKGFLKQRTYDYFSEGLKAGLEPLTTNPVELALIKAREMDRYIYGQRIFAEMKDAGIAKFVRFGDKAPDDWEKINDRIARVLQYSDEAKGMVLRGEYYAPRGAATIINNHLSPGLAGVPAYDLVRQIGNMMNSAQLGLSAFHLGFTTLDASISKAALGFKQLSRGDIGKGLGNVAQSLNPAQAILNLMKGDKLFKAYMGDLSDPGMVPYVDALLYAGGRAQQDDIYRNEAIRDFRQALRKGNYGTAAMKVLPMIGDVVNKPIFEYLVPRQKLGVFMDLAKDAMDQEPSMTPERKAQVFGKIWDSVDNRMGQLVYDNVFWNRTLKDALMVSTRSVGWNLGTFREIGGGVADLRKIPQLKSVSDRTAYIAGMVFVTGVVGALTQYLYTGKGPDDAKDMFFPRTGKIRPDGTEDRISLPSYMKDIAEYGHDISGFVKYGDNPFNTLLNKIHPLLSTVGDLISNKDFFGGAIRSPGDTATRQAKDVGKFLVKQVEPFSVRNYQQQLQTSGAEPSVLDYLTSPSMFGLAPSPGYMTKTDAQTESAAVNRMHDALVSKFREEMRDGADWGEINERARAAGLSPQDRAWIRKSAVQRPAKHLKAFGNAG